MRRLLVCVCPSSIPLVQYYRASKAEIRALELQQHKADHSKQRFEHRLQRLEREVEQKELERQARAEKAARMKAAKEQQAVSAASVSGDEQPDVARVEAHKPASLTAEQKQLKITAATAQMALKKARKQLASNPDSIELKAQIPELEQACEETQGDYDAALGYTSVKTSPPPAAGADDKTARQLKTDMAMAKAAFRKAERALAEGPDNGQLENQLTDAKKTLDSAAKAFAYHMASKETD